MSTFTITSGGREIVIPVIKRSLDEGFINGKPATAPSFGCVPRDFRVDPIRMQDRPDSMDVYTDDKAKEVYDKQMEAQSTLLHIFFRNGKPAFDHLDQDGFPDCWYHGPAHAVMATCMRDNDPIPRINGVAGATLLGRTNGGWSGLAMQDMRENGAPLMGTGVGEWPQWTRDKRYNTPEFRDARMKHQILEDWYDTSAEVYGQVMTQRQMVTTILNKNPGSGDWNKFSHAMGVLGIGYLDGRFHPIVIQSWKGWGLAGVGLLYDLWPNNYCGPRTITPG